MTTRRKRCERCDALPAEPVRLNGWSGHLCSACRRDVAAQAVKSSDDVRRSSPASRLSERRRSSTW